MPCHAHVSTSEFPLMGTASECLAVDVDMKTTRPGIPGSSSHLAHFVYQVDEIGIDNDSKVMGNVQHSTHQSTIHPVLANQDRNGSTGTRI